MAFLLLEQIKGNYHVLRVENSKQLIKCFPIEVRFLCAFLFIMIINQISNLLFCLLSWFLCLLTRLIFSGFCGKKTHSKHGGFERKTDNDSRTFFHRRSYRVDRVVFASIPSSDELLMPCLLESPKTKKMNKEICHLLNLFGTPRSCNGFRN